MNGKRRSVVTGIALALAGAVFSAHAATSSYDVAGVSKVRFRLPGELTVRLGSQEKLVAEAESQVLQKLDIAVRGDQLVIASKGSFKTDKPLRFTLTLKSLSSLKNEGSGNVAIDGFGGNGIEADAAGSGNIRLANMKPARLHLRISGSGNVEAAGSGNALVARVDGSGTIAAADYRAQSVQASISGSGDIRVHAEQELDAAISGAGNIEYRGKAKVTQSITGAGSVDRL